MKYHHSIIFLCIILLAGCSSNSSLTSSFGTRKYTKGTFWNRPDKVEATAKNEIKNTDNLVDITFNKQASAIQAVLQNTKTNTVVTPYTHTQLHLLKQNSVAIAFLPKQQINTPPIKKDPNDPDNQPVDKKTSGIMFLIIGAVFLIGLLLSPFVVFLMSISPLVFIMLALLSILVGLYFLLLAGTDAKPKTSTDTSKQTHIGKPGFVLGLISFFVAALLLIVVLSIVLSGGSLTLPVLFFLVFFITSILSIVLCLISLSRPNEASPKDAKTGLALGTIALMALLLLFIIGINHIIL